MATAFAAVLDVLMSFSFDLALIQRTDAVLWIDALNRQGLAARVRQTRRHLKRKPRQRRYESAGRLARVLADSGFTDIGRHWLPVHIASHLKALQSALETRVAVSLLASMPLAGRLFGHSVVFVARRAALVAWSRVGVSLVARSLRPAPCAATPNLRLGVASRFP